MSVDERTKNAWCGKAWCETRNHLDDEVKQLRAELAAAQAERDEWRRRAESAGVESDGRDPNYG